MGDDDDDDGALDAQTTLLLQAARAHVQAMQRSGNAEAAPADVPSGVAADDDTPEELELHV